MGAFDAEFRDTWAHGVGVRPDKAAGWSSLICGEAPVDLVGGVFSDAMGSLDLEVFVNRGRPTRAESMSATASVATTASHLQVRCNLTGRRCVQTVTTTYRERT